MPSKSTVPDKRQAPSKARHASDPRSPDNSTTSESSQGIITHGGLFAGGLLLLALLPCLLMVGPLAAGRIPFYMDPVMYFFPMRWHAAHMLASGEWPWWNRCILAGMPLFANPQSALAYPFHWPFLAAPGGFTWLFPALLQLGLFGSFTAMLLRRWGVSMGLALMLGVSALAGNFGWTRLQFGNFMNVLPWMPLLLWATDRAIAGHVRSLALGLICVALLLLAGAHQIAAYALFAHILFYLWMTLTDAQTRRSGGAGLALVLVGGVCLGALGWLPQLHFLRETARGEALDPVPVLSGSMPDLATLIRVFAGVADPRTADAESSASIGLFVLASAFLVPASPTVRRRWLGSLLVALLLSLLSLRVVMEPILKAFPIAGVFHGPRRMLGIAHYWFLLTAGLSLASWFRADPEAKSSHCRRPAGAVSLCVALGGVLAILASPEPREGTQVILLVADALPAIVLALLLAFGTAPSPIKFVIAASMPIHLALLSTNTIQTTPLATQTPAEIYKTPSFLLPDSPEAGPNPRIQFPRRFLSLDWERASSYDFKRPDLPDWRLPNLSMLDAREDLGGYEPARSPRYIRWAAQASGWPSGRQPWASHFGLIHPRHPDDLPGIAPLREAGVTDVILPRWGIPLYLRQQSETQWFGHTPALTAEPLEVRLVIIPGKAPSQPRSLILAQNGRILRTAMLDDDAGATLPLSLADGPPMLDHFRAFGALAPSPEGGTSPAPPDATPYEAVLLLSPGDTLVGVYLWSETFAREFHPSRAGIMAMHASLRPGTSASAPPVMLNDWLKFLLPDGTPAPQPEILESRISGNEIFLRIAPTAPGPTTLEIHDAFWPGWHVSVNGQRTHIRPSGRGEEGLWRRLDLPPSDTAGQPMDVSLSYTPTGLVPALFLTLLGMGILLSLFYPRAWGVLSVRPIEARQPPQPPA